MSLAWICRWAAPLILAAGCASAGFPDVIDPQEIGSSLGGPSIDRVRDAGNVRIPIGGPWRGESDGAAVPGELIVIEGDNFGRLPTVSIGGRATSVLARTAGGGIIARVPVGVPSGKVPVSVSQPKGRAQKDLLVRRFSVVVHDGKLHVLEVQKDGVRPIGPPLAVPGAHTVRLSSDGAAAYVLAGNKLVTLDLATVRISQQMALDHAAEQLTTANDVPLLAVIGGGKLTLFSTQLSNRPAPYQAIELPKELRGARSLELSPDGKLLAGLEVETNRLVTFEVQENPPATRLFNIVEILPGERLSLVRDLSWAADGDTLWVVSGDNAKSLPAVQPTRLTAVRLLPRDGKQDPKSEELMSVWRTHVVTGATAPLHIAVARGQPLASGTTIRLPPEKAAVFISSVAENLFKLAETTFGPAAVDKLWRPSRPAMIVRADINGGGGPLFASPILMSSVDLTPDAQWVVATAVRLAPAPSDKAVVLDFGVVFSPVWGSPTPTFVSLSTMTAAELKPPFSIGEVRIQP
jgi:hypothetical protein